MFCGCREGRSGFTQLLQALSADSAYSDGTLAKQNAGQTAEQGYAAARPHVLDGKGQVTDGIGPQASPAEQTAAYQAFADPNAPGSCQSGDVETLKHEVLPVGPAESSTDPSLQISGQPDAWEATHGEGHLEGATADEQAWNGAVQAIMHGESCTDPSLQISGQPDAWEATHGEGHLEGATGDQQSWNGAVQAVMQGESCTDPSLQISGQPDAWEATHGEGHLEGATADEQAWNGAVQAIMQGESCTDPSLQISGQPNAWEATHGEGHLEGATADEQAWNGAVQAVMQGESCTDPSLQISWQPNAWEATHGEGHLEGATADEQAWNGAVQAVMQGESCTDPSLQISGQPNAWEATHGEGHLEGATADEQAWNGAVQAVMQGESCTDPSLQISGQPNAWEATHGEGHPEGATADEQACNGAVQSDTQGESCTDLALQISGQAEGATGHGQAGSQAEPAHQQTSIDRPHSPARPADTNVNQHFADHSSQASAWLDGEGADGMIPVPRPNLVMTGDEAQGPLQPVGQTVGTGICWQPMTWTHAQCSLGTFPADFTITAGNPGWLSGWRMVQRIRMPACICSKVRFQHRHVQASLPYMLTARATTRNGGHECADTGPPNSQAFRLCAGVCTLVASQAASVVGRLFSL